MLKYIVSGEKPVSTNTDIEEIDTIVTKVKDRKEVTIAYMRQWDRELSIRRETREETRIETRKETKQEDALEAIRFDQKKDIPIEITRERLQESFGYDDDTINELIAQVATESVVSQQAT
jgi:hypothetical protein